VNAGCSGSVEKLSGEFADRRGGIVLENAEGVLELFTKWGDNGRRPRLGRDAEELDDDLPMIARAR
jgi:hypothetical protein